MEEEQNNTIEQDTPMQLDILKFDKRVFILSLIRRIYITIIVFVVLLILVLVALPFISDQKWVAACTIYRQTRNDTIESNLPLLFGKTDEKTILRTIKRDGNLRAVIEKTGMNIEPGQLSRLIDVSIDRNKIITITVTSDQQKISRNNSKCNGGSFSCFLYKSPE